MNPAAAIRMPGLAGARILVTGASRGIGRATARMLAASGASVGLAYGSSTAAAREAEAEAREAGRAAGQDVDLWVEPADLRVPDQVDRLFARVDREFGGLDGFVANAGVWNAEPAPLARLAPSAWSELIETNLTSVYLTTRAAAERMEAGGSIVLVSSTAAQRGEAEHSHYAASKGAVNAFCKSIAVELGPRGIRVNAVAPGWVDTDMSASVLRSPQRTAVESEIPLRRVAAAEDVAGPIVFLLSGLARQMTAEVMNVNGGSVRCG